MKKFSLPTLFRFLKKQNKPVQKAIPTREELEKKVVEGAKKAVQDYRAVFERLAEYDRA